ncbi:MAG: alpha/beta hydrolase [Clostridiales bacterium]|nr:alpha/beta hydrolase [Clostridiales bacterium]
MDISLYYEEKGSGFPLIMLHGNGEEHGYFEHQTDCFAENYRVIAIDTRGHGRSPRGEGEFSIKRFADDLYGFMTEHGIEKAHILGFSDGGNIAITFALKHPEMIEKLIVDGANLYPAGVKRRIQRPIELGYYAVKLFAAFSSNAKTKAEMLSLMVNQPNIAPEELKKLNMPVLVMAGTDDMIRQEHTELIAASIPGAKLVILPGDHFIARNNSNAFNAAVRDFLEA